MHSEIRSPGHRLTGITSHDKIWMNTQY